MRIRNPWPVAIFRLVTVLVVCGLAGWAGGYPVVGLLVGTAGYLGWQMRNLVRLERWLRKGRRIHPPQSQGLWEVIFDNLYRLQRRHRVRRQRLATLLRRFKESANAMPDATVVLRGQGEMQWWNQSATRYLGLRWPQDEGQRVANLLRHPDFAAFLQEADYRRAIKVPSPVDERIVLEVRIVPYGDNQRLLLGRDVTRLHRLETMRRDFVANISHELRTPLTVIQGMAETLAEYGVTDVDELRGSLDMVQQQTRRMGRLIDDLLLLSRLETGERPLESNTVNVPSLLRGLAEEARTVSAGRHEITLEVDETLRLSGDENELRSAFSNLVNNAVKYTPDQGRIAVRWFQQGEEARVEVSDSGIGIPPHHIPRLTERFYRVDSGRTTSSGGTGLGLAIVKHVLSRHQGQLHITSQPEHGSTFTCSFREFFRIDGEQTGPRSAGRPARASTAAATRS